MNIREWINSDRESIHQLHLDAFDKEEGPSVAKLALDLLDDVTALPVLSLVAEQDETIIGNVIFSSVIIEGSEDVSAFILAPLAISPSEQGKGIGTQLIQTGLEILRERRAQIVFVYGDPKYYTRTGFISGHRINPPQKLSYPIEAWMAQELTEGALEKASGTARTAASLSAPDHW